MKKSEYNNFDGNWKQYQGSKNVVYSITNKQNGIIYIGITQSLKKRLRDYGALISSKKKYSISTYIGRVLKKYGASNFNFDVIKINNNYEECGLDEIYWIDFLRQNNIKIYNLNEGGTSGKNFNTPSGTEIYNSKFNETDIINIFKMYHNSKLSSNTIAKKYNTTNTVILNLLNGKTYKKIASNLCAKYPELRKFSFYTGTNNSNSGENCYKSKFIKDDILNIFKLYHEQQLSSEEISKIYSVVRSSIIKILQGKTYKNISIKLIDEYPSIRTSTFHLHGH